jgi:hypothetical protein
MIGSPEDRRPIINSAIIGLDEEEDVIMSEDEQEPVAKAKEVTGPSLKRSRLKATGRKR